MNNQEFESLLCTITAGTVDKIISRTGWKEDIALERFLNSKIYALLEDEKTKLWHYSVTMLANLFCDEIEGKNIEWESLI